MPRLEFPEVLKFEVTVDEIVQTARLILAQTKQAKVREAMRKMVDELKTANEQLVEEVLAPLCSVKTKETFEDQFGKIHERFKRQYLSPRPVLLSINCGLITDQINALVQSQQWKKSIGFARAVTRLEMIGKKWIADDAELARADRAMFGAINYFLDQIAMAKSKTARYKEYVDSVKPLEQHYVAIRDQMAELEKLSAQL